MTLINYVHNHSFIFKLGPDFPPSGLHVVHVGKRSAKAKWNILQSWQPYGIATCYALGIAEHAKVEEPFNVTYYVSLDQRKFLFENLNPSTRYFVRIAAVTSAGVGTFSKLVTFVTKGSK